MRSALSRTLAVLATAAAAVALALPAGAALASPAAPAVTAYTVLDSRGDSGGGGNDWATDTIVRTLVIHQTGGTPGAWTFTATVSDSGSFVTIPHVLAPNQSFAGSTIVAKVNGTLTGQASYSFTASRLPQDNLVPTQESGTPASGPRTTSLWYEQAFPAGTTFGGPGIGSYGWSYTGPNCNVRVPGGVVTLHEQWADTSLNGDGQLPGDGNITGACPVI